ncbi:Highly reducing polyketide synthase [Cladobotryum mycophilum]|uniref:Highly reducing polyketide synthase n=1 Tax=Cladobotryum mycophilum TaxID=491253 RepID=A0ABR0SJV3_9HYPO
MVANDSSALRQNADYSVQTRENAVLSFTEDSGTTGVSNAPTLPSNGKLGSVQTPIAVVGMACRLPGQSRTPKSLWDFIERGGIAANTPPESRFNLEGHYDGSKKPHTMRSPGGMFLEYIDPHDFDAQFFNIPTVDAVAMDPQQRQLLEVVYECLENSGVPLEVISGSKTGCFVGSYAVDFGDMQARDPEDRAESITIGIGRAILSNRISHFLNIKGPSMTIDTACSGSLVSVDVACQYLNAHQADGMLVAGANIYLSPDHNMDMGAMRGASSATGKCHTFDAKADGYIKGEAVNAVYLKRLDDAIRDGDPIRAVIRGSATNSDGWTPGIASPSSDAQATAIRAAYANAGIRDFNETGYLECHGTGTLAGDPIEVSGAASVFAPTRTSENPLIIGSIKSNIGHSEPAAGISGLLKAVLAVETGIIPGNPTFIDPNPKIDFEKLRVRATRATIQWPSNTPFRRASVNSFGYGGSNAHVVLDAAEHIVSKSNLTHISSYNQDVEDFFDLGEPAVSKTPKLLVTSANDEESLKRYIDTLSSHLINPGVKVELDDLAYTLGVRRSKHFQRGFTVTKSTKLETESFTFGKLKSEAPRIGFVFTGQGAQWSQMGKELVETFPSARSLLQKLDKALQSLPSPPKWSLISELSEVRSPEHLRLPEFSQPLVTALQLATLTVLRSWGINATRVVGHSSGEIAAAAAAGLITYEDAIKIAYFRGLAAKRLPSQTPVGMLAVGVGEEVVKGYLDPTDEPVQIACYNSPNSLTLSGSVGALERVKSRLQEDSHFARLLQVDLAYHSKYMSEIGDLYETLLHQDVGPALKGSPQVKMFSSVTGAELELPPNAAYWKSNMVSPVRFTQATTELLSGKQGADFMIEIGPSNALAGPVAQIKKALSSGGNGIEYTSAAKRGPNTVLSLYEAAGKLFIAGGNVDLAKVNQEEENTKKPSFIVDLPNYSWNHSKIYWQESQASKDWRFRKFVHHDLLGSKDHKMGHEIIFPGAGYVAMAVEAIFQKSFSTDWDGKVPEKYRFRLRDLKFPRALVLGENTEHKINLVLTAVPRSNKSWYEYKVSSLGENDIWTEHSTGFVRIDTEFKETTAPEGALEPLSYPTPGHLWYKAMKDAGYNFGPQFQQHLKVEAAIGTLTNRSEVSFQPPTSTWDQSDYPIHPANMDGAFQSVAPSLWEGDRSSINAVLVPAIVDSLTIYPGHKDVQRGISVATSEYLGVGRKESKKNYSSSCKVYSPTDGSVLLELNGLRYHQLETRGDVYSSHPYARVGWKPDVTFVTESQLQDHVKDEVKDVALQKVIDLLAHKFPTLQVLEANLDQADASTFWFNEESTSSTRAAYSGYHFLTSNSTTLVNLQDKHAGNGNAAFTLSDLTRPDFVAPKTDVDFIIAKASSTHGEAFEAALKNLRGMLKPNGHILLIEIDVAVNGNGVNGTTLKDIPTILSQHGFENVREIFPLGSKNSAYLARGAAVDAADEKTVNIVHLSETTEQLSEVKGSLTKQGWSLVEHSYPFTSLQTGSNVLVIDELVDSVLDTLTSEQWNILQALITKESNMLWVTEGGQLKVTNPTKAAAPGFFRVIRAEEPILRLFTLDVESTSGPATISSIDSVLQILLKAAPSTQVESEFVERDGVMHVSRVLPDEGLNEVKLEPLQGTKPQTMSLHDSQSLIRLRAEHIGNIDSLSYGQISEGPVPLRPNHVEVEICAAGVNFKDAAVTIGIVPENEHLLGLEGAGIVTRIADDVTNFKVGQRVVVFEKGTFANRIQATTERTHALPDWMTFEEASTLPAVYLTSIYSLFYLANMKKGRKQSVLVHSASGGVGIASIQLAQHVGAEVFATVGTPEKREFLKTTFGIPDDHIFSSRNTDFAGEILKVTNGTGVDVILNSLTGELLDESWRIIADGGIMVEIGKKDILDRNSLSMEPFSRNASFRALDFSYREISDKLIAQILSELFELLEARHVKPIAPVTLFSFEDIPAAFRVIRSGKHIGKLVISNGQEAKIEVPVRPLPQQLSFRSDASYLIVGGLKGLCGSLAVYLVKKGVKHISVLARSGYSDEKSQGVIKTIKALGAHIDLLQGDVTDVEDIRRVFKETKVPIGGIVQGAMVLKDRTFASMTVDEYHGALACKIAGTWNLHNVALEQNLELDFFTMLSSISGVVGQKGQANYAAGNAVLDAFAVYRQSLGLPATSVDLGVIEDVGYIHDHDGLQQNLDTSIWTGINEGLLRRILEYSILQQVSDETKRLSPISSAQLVTGIPVPQPENSQLSRDARFAPLFISAGGNGAAKSGASDGSREIQAFLLLARSPAEPTAVVTAALDIVNKHLTKTLRLPEPMEPGRPLSTYGLDSLAAVEIRNWVRMTLGAELTTLEIVNASSLLSLCEKIVSKLRPAA